MIVGKTDMAAERPFRLVMAPRRGNEVAAILLQERHEQCVGGSDRLEQVVAVWGLPLEVAAGAIADALRQNDVSPLRGTRLPRTGERPIDLDEATGVRLSLALLALKPLRKLDRMEDILDKIEDMSREETLYWFSKCMNGHKQRAAKALRVLLSQEG